MHAGVHEDGCIYCGIAVDGYDDVIYPQREVHTYQVSRIRRETHASALILTLTRLTFAISRFSFVQKLLLNNNKP